MVIFSTPCQMVYPLSSLTIHILMFSENKVNLRMIYGKLSSKCEMTSVPQRCSNVDLLTKVKTAVG